MQTTQKFSYQLRAWLSGQQQRRDLPFVLSRTPSAAATLKMRVDWIFDLIGWIRREGAAGSSPATRMEFLLDILDQNQEKKLSVAQALRSVVFDTRGLELFTHIGMLKEDHWISEFFSRLVEKLPLRAPEEQELHFIFSENIRSARDIQWLELLDAKTLTRIVQLFHFQVGEPEQNWNSLRSDAEQALLLLAMRLQGIGMSSAIRQRLSEKDFQKLPFYDLPTDIKAFLSEKNKSPRKAKATEIHKRLEETKACLEDVRQHLHEHGVSIAIVYRMEKLECLIKRMQDILDLLQSSGANPLALSKFIESLIHENISRHSLRHLIDQNLALLARKIVERTGESGEGYIIRSAPDHVKFIKSALGGGFMTGFTSLFKFLIYNLGWASLASGILGAINYSVSFLIIHFCHFTLGTKQPSMTASALAAEMNGNPEDLVDEVIHLIRSQFVAILGNLMGVIPTVALFCIVYHQFTGDSLMSSEKAHHVISDFSILGPTPLYAYFTGILLWVSSVFSGWMDNFFAFHRYPSAIASHRGLQFLLGPEKAKAFALWVRKHVLGVCSSLSLGILLALSPLYLQSWGFHMDVRHVTLSSGALTAAMVVLPKEVFLTEAFWLAVSGIIAMGFLNVTVSFGLALLVAINARKVETPTRLKIYRLVIQRILTQPLALIWPQKEKKRELSDLPIPSSLAAQFLNVSAFKLLKLLFPKPVRSTIPDSQDET